MGPPVPNRRVVLVSTAGLHLRGDRPFEGRAGDYRVIPRDVGAGDLIMSHVSSNFDRMGFQQDRNVVFPLDRLRELEMEGRIGSTSNHHYSFMGATHPSIMEPAARELAATLRESRVNAALLIPV